MANLVIVESPSKAGNIKSYLGSNYKVMASTGHVRDLPKSTLGVDVDNNFEAHYINIRGKGDLIKSLKKEAKAADKVFLATDPDREGEAISWHLATTLGLPEEKIRRITFNEITKSAVKDAIKHPRAIDMDRVNSQQTRRILDRIVGYKLSPFLWKNVRSGLSAGRVQSVATRIIVEREEEIRAFVPQEFWTVDVLLEKEDGHKVNARFYGNANGKLKLSNSADADDVLSEAKANGFKVSAVRSASKTKMPAPPFTTSTMQQEAFRKLGFQSQRIMKVAQELYEGINLGAEFGGVQGLITYMRTDSLRVSSEAQAAAAEYISGKYGDEYKPAQPRVYKSKANAQDAHEAIRPANIAIEPAKIRKMLTPDQYKLYKLIWERFIASQMASAVLDTVSVDFESGKYVFRSSGYTVRFQGFMALYEESNDENESVDDELGANECLPELKKGEVLTAKEYQPQQRFTEPSPRYTEASLIKFLEDKGIGRPSTYAPIIQTIVARNYVKREGKSLVPTQLGEVITKLMKESFADIVDYEFTAKMEDDLDKIAQGSATMTDVLSEFYQSFSQDLSRADAEAAKKPIEVPDVQTDIVCDKCGSLMVIKNGRFGKFAACPNYPDCKNTKPITKDGKLAVPEEKPVIMADFKCELCGGDMVQRTGKYGAFYACVNYPKCKGTKQKTKDIGVDCPKCSSKIVMKWGRNKTVFFSCEKYPDCDFSTWDLPTNEKCPQCGEMLYVKKSKGQLVCHDKTCGYKADMTDEQKDKYNKFD
jgi:DNA topoisomerase-1